MHDSLVNIQRFLSLEFFAAGVAHENLVAFVLF